SELRVELEAGFPCSTSSLQNASLALPRRDASRVQATSAMYRVVVFTVPSDSGAAGRRQFSFRLRPRRIPTVSCSIQRLSPIGPWLRRVARGVGGFLSYSACRRRVFCPPGA